MGGKRKSWALNESLWEEHRVLKEQIDDIRSQKEALLKEQEDNEQIHEKNHSVLDSLKEKLAEIKRSF